MDLWVHFFYFNYLYGFLVKLILFAFMLYSNICYASTLSENELLVLSQDAQWNKLLHINGNNYEKSYITSNEFFLSKDKIKTPYKELKSTLKAIFLPVDDNNKHAQCMFPARLMFLKKKIDFSRIGVLPDVKCDEYLNWKKIHKADSISVVFASGYMSNPASMYGHLFIKFNNKNLNELLDKSLNYGAIVPKDENPVAYIIRGVFGGYKAGYSDQQFFRHHHNYGDVERRDMWEYKLSLGKSDLDFLIAHIWELMNQEFDYYFIDENCAFHIAKLLEVVLDLNLISDESRWVIPSSVSKSLIEITHDQIPLVENITYIPSSDSRTYKMVENLTSEEKIISSQLILSDFDFSNSDYANRSLKDKKKIIETLIQFQKSKLSHDSNNEKFNKLKNKLLKERMRLPSGIGSVILDDTNKAAPHLGAKPSKFSLGINLFEDDQPYVNLGFRMAYFDDVSINTSRKKFGNLEMIDLELITDGNDIKVYKLDLIDIKSLYLPSDPFNSKSSEAWAVKAGYGPIRDSCINCGVYFLDGHYGGSYQLNYDSLFYTMLGGRVYVGDKDDVQLSVLSGLISQLNDKTKIKIELQKRAKVNLSGSDKLIFNLELNYQYSKNNEIRLFTNHQLETIIGIKYNHFWDF